MYHWLRKSFLELLIRWPMLRAGALQISIFLRRRSTGEFGSRKTKAQHVAAISEAHTNSSIDALRRQNSTETAQWRSLICEQVRHRSSSKSQRRSTALDHDAIVEVGGILGSWGELMNGGLSWSCMKLAYVSDRHHNLQRDLIPVSTFYANAAQPRPIATIHGTWGP